MKQKTFAVIGFGDRGEVYSRYALNHADEMKIVAVVEPNPVRKKYAQELFGIDDEMCFNSVEDFVKQGRVADCVINATMDTLHIPTTLPLLPLGYDILLEKPITNNKEELLLLQSEIKKYGNRVVVCHVMRYTPFYRGIKKILLSGEIGRVKHINTEENVGFAHSAISFIRGKWGSKKECGSSMLLQKCCHDTDLICWLNNTTRPALITSFGSQEFFVENNAPKGAGTRCLVDCAVEKDCPFSARKIHLDNDPMGILVWADLNKLPEEVTMEEKEEYLKTTSPFGKCIYKTGSDTVDQQSVMIRFQNGTTATHTMIKGCARAGRRVKIYGELGEIEGFTEENCFYVRTYNEKNILMNERMVDVSKEIVDINDHHNGGDAGIVEDFLAVVNGEEPSVSTSYFDNSIDSHLVVYAGDESMEQGKYVLLK